MSIGKGPKIQVSKPTRIAKKPRVDKSRPPESARNQRRILAKENKKTVKVGKE